MVALLIVIAVSSSATVTGKTKHHAAFRRANRITVAAALTLVEDGLVSPDDPIAKYMPQFAHMNVGVATAKSGY